MVKSTIIVYTDGSCKNNGKTNAKGGIGIYFGKNDKRNYSGPLKGMNQTNNRAELSAVIKALEIINLDDHACIYTDSKYVMLSITKWMDQWIINKWKASSGRPVKNKDLFKYLNNLIELKRQRRSTVIWKWVKGHSTSYGNQQADLLATQGSKMLS